MTKEEKKAFRLGFAAGFSISFDGWNGQVFKEFNRPFTESDEFVKALNKFTKDYEVLKHEQAKLFNCSHPSKHERDRSRTYLNGAPTGSLPSPLYPRTIPSFQFFSDNPDHNSGSNYQSKQFTGKE
jgi:hypothetical protein